MKTRIYFTAAGVFLAALGAGFGQPVITRQPSDLALALGTPVATFTVSASGTMPLGYQWRLDGVDLSGATNNFFLVHSVQFTNAGGYTVVVTNLAGTATSRIAQLSVAGGWTFTDAQGTSMPYRLFLPPNYDPLTKYPLVLFWNGSSDAGSTEVGTDNLAQLTDNGQFSFLTASNLATFPCFYLAPQVPFFPNSSTEAYKFLNWATNLLSHLEAQYSIDPDRFYVTGLSGGGFATWAMLARYPDLLAAVVPLSGSWYWNSPLDFLRSLHVPVWNFHAADDGIVLVGGSDSAVSSLRAAGASINYTRYDTGGHQIGPTAYRTPGLIPWIMAQRRGVASTTEPLLSITNPTRQALYQTGATSLDLTGTAGALDRDVTQVLWTNSASGTEGAASGTNVWSLAAIPLAVDRTNGLIVTAITTSWAPSLGGTTTFNDTLTLIQSPIRSTLAFQGTNAVLNWTGGAPPYRVQRATDLAAGNWTDVLSNAIPPLTLPLEGQAGFYRIAGQ